MDFEKNYHIAFRLDKIREAYFPQMRLGQFLMNFIRSYELEKDMTPFMQKIASFFLLSCCGKSVTQIKPYVHNKLLT